MTNNEILFESAGKPTRFIISSGEHDGYVKYHSHRETVDNGDGTFTATDIFETVLSPFQGDVSIWGIDDHAICTIGSTYEYYDYDLTLDGVTRIEKDIHGDLHITVIFMELKY